jgi:lipopolysaccharide export system permease protein
MRASGFKWQQLLRPLFNLTLPVAAFLLLSNLALAPAASSLSDRKLEEALRTAAVWGLQAGQFHALQGGELVIYVEALENDGRTLRNVFIYQDQGETEQVWIAERGEYWLDPETRSRYLTLENGQITQAVQGQLDVRILGFQRNDLLLPEPEVKAADVKLASLSTADLLAEADAPAWAELQ